MALLHMRSCDGALSANSGFGSRNCMCLVVPEGNLEQRGLDNGLVTFTGSHTIQLCGSMGSRGRSHLSLSGVRLLFLLPLHAFCCQIQPLLVAVLVQHQVLGCRQPTCELHETSQTSVNPLQHGRCCRHMLQHVNCVSYQEQWILIGFSCAFSPDPSLPPQDILRMFQ